MKRYNLEDPGILREHVRVMIENPEGEWVKWEDAEKEIDGAYKYKAGYFTGQNSKPKADSIECNCQEQIQSYYKQRQDLMDKFTSRELIPETYSWFCPAHGYKRR